MTKLYHVRINEGRVYRSYFALKNRKLAQIVNLSILNALIFFNVPIIDPHEQHLKILYDFLSFFNKRSRNKAFLRIINPKLEKTSIIKRTLSSLI